MLFWKKWDIGGRLTVSWKYLKTLDTIKFLGEDFYIPHDAPGLMRAFYGKTWQIPIKDVQSKTGLAFKTKKILARPGKMFFFARRFIRTRMRIREEARRSKLIL